MKSPPQTPENKMKIKRSKRKSTRKRVGCTWVLDNP